MNLRPAIIHYGWMERLLIRVLFAVVVERHIPASLSSFTISAPNGFARWVDVHFLLNPSVFVVCRYLLWAALLLYVLRVGWALVLPYLSLLSIAVGTIINSQGAIAHYLQIVSLVLCTQTAAHYYGLIQQRRGRSDSGGTRFGASMDERKLVPPVTQSRAASEDRVISWSQQAIIATYLVSALTKLIHTGGMWFFQSPMMAVQIIKTTDQDYYDRLDADAYGSGAAMADWMVQHPILVALVLGSGLLLELSSPVALLGRRYALCYGLALVAFHESVQRIMKLNFLYNEYLIWIYLVNVPFWLWLGLRELRRRAG